MEIGQPGAVPIPDVAELPQHIGCVEPSRRRIDPNRVKLGCFGELTCQIVVAADDAPTIALHTDQTAMLPVPNAVLVRAFQYAL